MMVLAIRRLLLGFLTLVLTLLLVFVMVRLIPGNPAAVLLSDDATSEQIDYVTSLWGLNEPIPVQFGVYINNLLHGDAGDSFQYQTTAGSAGQDAMSLVVSRLPLTVELALASIFLSIVIAVPLGLLSALWRDTWFDHTTMGATLMLGSIPNFWIGMQLILLFGVTLRLLPTGGSGSLKHLILPAITLALPFIAVLTRLTRTEVARVMQAEFITTARAKGLDSQTVVIRHALRNAMIPIATILGLRLGGLLNGAVVVEVLFGWPGLGRLLIDAINARDYPIIQVVVPLAAVLYVAINIAVDLLYGVLDPRVRMGRS